MASRKTRARAQAVKKRERSMDEDMLDGDNATTINDIGPLGSMDEEGIAGDMKSPGDRDDNEDMPDADIGSSDETMADAAGSGVEEAVPGEMSDERVTRQGRAQTTRHRPSDKRGNKAMAHRKRAARR